MGVQQFLAFSCSESWASYTGTKVHAFFFFFSYRSTDLTATRGRRCSISFSLVFAPMEKLFYTCLQAKRQTKQNRQSKLLCALNGLGHVGPQWILQISTQGWAVCPLQFSHLWKQPNWRTTSGWIPVLPIDLFLVLTGDHEAQAGLSELAIRSSREPSNGADNQNPDPLQ